MGPAQELLHLVQVQFLIYSTTRWETSWTFWGHHISKFFPRTCNLIWHLHNLILFNSHQGCSKSHLFFPQFGFKLFCKLHIILSLPSFIPIKRPCWHKSRIPLICNVQLIQILYHGRLCFDKEFDTKNQ